MVLEVRSSVRARREYLHPSPASYPGGTESPGGETGRTERTFCVNRSIVITSYGANNVMVKGSDVYYIRHTLGWCSIL